MSNNKVTDAKRGTKEYKKAYNDYYYKNHGDEYKERMRIKYAEMKNNDWKCESCNKTIKEVCKKSHLKSKKHLKLLQNPKKEEPQGEDQ